MPPNKHEDRNTQRLEIMHRFDREQFAELLCLGQVVLNTYARLEQKLDALMAQSKEMTDFIARLNTATNTIAVRVAALKDKITQGGMSEADERAGISEADAIVGTLENIGADPADPLPTPEVPPII